MLRIRQNVLRICMCSYISYRSYIYSDTSDGAGKVYRTENYEDSLKVQKTYGPWSTQRST